MTTSTTSFMEIIKIRIKLLSLLLLFLICVFFVQGELRIHFCITHYISNVYNTTTNDDCIPRHTDRQTDRHTMNEHH